MGERKKRYTYADNAELCKRWQTGDKEAGDALCVANKGLVNEIALKYSVKYGSNWYEDFCQEGMIGLLEAAKKYEPELGAFSTCRKQKWSGFLVCGFNSDTPSRSTFR